MRSLEVPKTLLFSGIFLAGVNMNAFAAKNLETSLLNTKQSHRSKFSSQPNLDKGEMTMPMQVSIIYIIKQSLPDFLSQLTSRNKLKLTMSESVSGTLEKISLPLQTELVLEELSTSYGLEWHMQGRHLYVSNSLENTNRLINLGNLKLFQLKQMIAQAGLNPGANKMTYLAEKNAVTLIGSAKYIARVEQLISQYQTSSDNN